MSKHVLSSLSLLGALAGAVPSAHAQLVVGVQTNAANTFNAAVWHIDLTSGDRTLLFPGGASAIAVDDAGGRVFVANGSELSLWNYGSGPAATLLGTVLKPSGAALNVTGLGYGGGRLFAATPSTGAPASQWLFEIDLATLIATPMPTTVGLSWIEAVSFDATSGLFYLQHDSGWLYTMDILGGGAPQVVSDIQFGPDGGTLGANGLYYVTYDNAASIPIFNLATNAYTGSSIWSPYYNGLDAAGADWAPNLTAAAGPRVYCQPSPVTGNHLRTLHAGAPSASAGSGFTITHTQIPSSSRVQPHFSLSGPASAPFFGGLRCVRVPVFRMPQTQSVSGTYVLDFNAYIASGANPGLVAGQTVWFQLATQTAAGAANGTFTLSAAVRFTIAP
jgi:hypothetical protein